jgi:hypothetical protein
LGFEINTLPASPGSGVGRFEPIAAADRRDDQVQRRMFGMPALFDEVVGGLVAGADFDELLIAGVVLTEMSTQAALSVVDVDHGESPFVLWMKPVRGDAES